MIVDYSIEIFFVEIQNHLVKYISTYGDNNDKCEDKLTREEKSLKSNSN